MNNTAQPLFNYLYLRDTPIPKADLIIGFGHFDPKIPRQCCELHRQGYAPRILFTGGIGAGTADIGMAEGLYFREYARRHYPGIAEDVFLVEHTSTHIGENIENSLVLLEQAGVLADLRSVILVANAYRQRRVWLACRKQVSDARLINAPPLRHLRQNTQCLQKKGKIWICCLRAN